MHAVRDVRDVKGVVGGRWAAGRRAANRLTSGGVFVSVYRWRGHSSPDMNF